jgi:hypothetical protein
LVSKLTFFTRPKKLFKFGMNLQVHGRVDGVCDEHRRSLVEAELPQHTLNVVLLDVHVVDERRLRHPEVTIMKAHGRETLWRMLGDQGVGVRLPDNLAVGEGVYLADEVHVQPRDLLHPRELQTRE